jgi:hypothetical protein
MDESQLNTFDKEQAEKLAGPGPPLDRHRGARPGGAADPGLQPVPPAGDLRRDAGHHDPAAQPRDDPVPRGPRVRGRGDDARRHGVRGPAGLGLVGARAAALPPGRRRTRFILWTQALHGNGMSSDRISRADRSFPRPAGWEHGRHVPAPFQPHHVSTLSPP